MTGANLMGLVRSQTRLIYGPSGVVSRHKTSMHGQIDLPAVYGWPRTSPAVGHCVERGSSVEQYFCGEWPKFSAVNTASMAVEGPSS